LLGRPKEPVQTNELKPTDALRASVKAETRSTSAWPAHKGEKRVEEQSELLPPISGKNGKEAPAATAGGTPTRQKEAGERGGAASAPLFTASVE
jgi:hypothetical protein